MSAAAMLEPASFSAQAWTVTTPGAPEMPAAVKTARSSSVSSESVPSATSATGRPSQSANTICGVSAA